MPHESQVVGWPGRTLFDADGSKIGKIEDVFADERTGRPAWATVSSGLFGRRHHFVPIEQAREVEDGVAVPVAGQLVKGAPNVDADGDLSREDEQLLYRHYGLDDGEPDGPDATPAAAVADRDDDDRRDDRREGGPPDRDARDRTAPGEARDARDARERDDHEGHPDAPEHGDRDDHHDDREQGHHRDRDDHARRDRDAPAYAHHDDRSRHDERVDVDADADRDARDAAQHDERTPGVPPTLQADATTEALARAERERLAAEEAEHDRLTAGQAGQAPQAAQTGGGGPAAREPAPLAAHDAPVLDRELAQEDLSVAPAVPDASAVGRPHVDDGYVPRRDHAIDVTGGAQDETAGRPGPHDAATTPVPGRSADDAAASGSSAGPPSAGTRLRRLVRSITPSKDDSHG